MIRKTPARVLVVVLWWAVGCAPSAPDPGPELDLMRLLPPKLPSPFHTGELAEALGAQRWVAQRIAYCLRKMGAAHQVGKQANAWLYELTELPGVERAA